VGGFTVRHRLGHVLGIHKVPYTRRQQSGVYFLVRGEQQADDKSGGDPNQSADGTVVHV